MRILLINTNRMRPPIAPVGLDYVGAAVRSSGHEVDLLDLCFEADPSAAVDRQLGRTDYGLIGLSFRNTDDCYYPGRGWFVPELAALVRRIKGRTSVPVVLGGVGFSVMPEAILRRTGADLGVRGDGEFALTRLADGETAAPGVIRPVGGGGGGAWTGERDLSRLPPMRRDLVDNPRYYREGGQIGFETKRGCAAGCIYCADPLAKGRATRCRPPAAVAEELAGLAGRGLVHLHTCDAEFNRPLEHAMAVCEALSRRGLGGQLRWYAYCVPVPFPQELARAMRRAGCVGVDFGADSGDDGMLRRLGRDFAAADVRAAVSRCRAQGMVCMCDLLLGGPGETAETVRRSIEFMRAVSPDRIGLSVGVRVYPGTPLARSAAREPGALRGPGSAADDFAEPCFFLTPELGEEIFPLVGRLAGDDPRFFFSDPTAAGRNYNYSGNEVLEEAIRSGYRGAYWDILRRLQEGLPAA